MGYEVMFERVQELKEKAVMAMGRGQGSTEVDKEIDHFLTANRYQILDILDDALYAYQEGTNG